MPTFETRCTACGEMRWPSLPYRPAGYVCVRCASVEPSKRAARKEQGIRSHKSRQKSSSDSEGAA